MSIFLGIDVGSSKTHAVLADESGRGLGLGEGGSGNHEVVGWDGLVQTLQTSFGQACQSAGIEPGQVAGAGFGISGLDWSSQELDHRRCIATLGLSAPVGMVNDALLGLLAGSDEGWGIAVVSGTGCNCWGWDRTRRRIGRMTGGGLAMGEAAGASELMTLAQIAVARAWSGRGLQTTLTGAFVRLAGASSLEDLLEGLMDRRYDLPPSAAPLVFAAANAGDEVACGLVELAGSELGEMACSVARQLNFEQLEFDLVMLGSMFRGGARLVEALRRRVHALAPGARLLPLSAPPVMGAVLLGMEQAGRQPTREVRQALVESCGRMLPVRKF